MTRIASAFKRLGKINEAAFIPCLTIGYPSLEVSRQLVPVMARQGADLIELGLPADDRMDVSNAEQHANQHALQRGVTITGCLSVAAEARRANEIPLILVCDYGAARTYGLAHIAADCAGSGVDGLAVHDLPLEDADELRAACDAAGIDLVLRVTPTSTDEQVRRVAEMASGFIICVSGAGIAEAEASVRRVRQFTDIPLAASFDMVTPEQAGQIALFADGIVVTGVVAHALDGASEEETIPAVGEAMRELKEATGK